MRWALVALAASMTLAGCTAWEAPSERCREVPSAARFQTWFEGTKNELDVVIADAGWTLHRGFVYLGEVDGRTRDVTIYIRDPANGTLDVAAYALGYIGSDSIDAARDDLAGVMEPLAQRLGVTVTYQGSVRECTG